MKYFALILVSIALTSCSKTYSCNCSSPYLDDYSYEIESKTKSNAEEICNNAGFSPGGSTSCSIE